MISGGCLHKVASFVSWKTPWGSQQSVVYAIHLCWFVRTLTLILTTFVLHLNNRMKTLYNCILLVTLLLILLTTETKAKNSIAISRDSTQTMASAKLLLTRLDEINATDKSHLSTSQRKSIRKEQRIIKGELKELHKGTYMPAGKLVVLLLVPFIIFNIAD